MQVDTGANTVTSGNPNLKPITSQNLDLSFEHYLSNAGIISFGLFDKELANYIITNETTQTYPNNGLFAGLVGGYMCKHLLMQIIRMRVVRNSTMSSALTSI